MRPPEVKVHIYRPERRFGYGVVMTGQSIDGPMMIRLWPDDPDTGERWVEYERNLDAPPEATLFFDDEVMRQLTKLFSDMTPPSEPDPKAHDILYESLDDARKVRDRLLALIEEKI